MNIQLSETVEYIDGKPTGTLGMVLIRCVSLRDVLSQENKYEVKRDREARSESGINRKT